MNYLIAVLSDRIQVEGAYSALEEAKFAMGEVAILGKGYKTADEYGLIDPANEAWKQMRLMMVWLVPFGFIAGFGFNAVTGLDTFPWAGAWGRGDGSLFWRRRGRSGLWQWRCSVLSQPLSGGQVFASGARVRC